MSNIYQPDSRYSGRHYDPNFTKEDRQGQNLDDKYQDIWDISHETTREYASNTFSPQRTPLFSPRNTPFSQKSVITKDVRNIFGKARDKVEQARVLSTKAQQKTNDLLRRHQKKLNKKEESLEHQRQKLVPKLQKQLDKWKRGNYKPSPSLDRYVRKDIKLSNKQNALDQKHLALEAQWNQQTDNNTAYQNIAKGLNRNTIQNISVTRNPENVNLFTPTLAGLNYNTPTNAEVVGNAVWSRYKPRIGANPNSQYPDAKYGSNEPYIVETMAGNQARTIDVRSLQHITPKQNVTQHSPRRRRSYQSASQNKQIPKQIPNQYPSSRSTRPYNYSSSSLQYPPHNRYNNPHRDSREFSNQRQGYSTGSSYKSQSSSRRPPVVSSSQGEYAYYNMSNMRQSPSTPEPEVLYSPEEQLLHLPRNPSGHQYPPPMKYNPWSKNPAWATQRFAPPGVNTLGSLHSATTHVNREPQQDDYNPLPQEVYSRSPAPSAPPAHLLQSHGSSTQTRTQEIPQLHLLHSQTTPSPTLNTTSSLPRVGLNSSTNQANQANRRQYSQPRFPATKDYNSYNRHNNPQPNLLLNINNNRQEARFTRDALVNQNPTIPNEYKVAYTMSGNPDSFQPSTNQVQQATSKHNTEVQTEDLRPNTTHSQDPYQEYNQNQAQAQ